MFRLLLLSLTVATLATPLIAQRPTPPTLRDPLSREIFRNATTPALTGRGIRQAAASGNLELAATLIDSLAGTATDENLAEAGEEIGSLWLLRLRTNEALTDEQRAVIGRIQNAVRSRAEDPAELDRAIAALSSESADERMAAIRKLQNGGDRAVARLVSSILTTPDPPQPEVIRMLTRLGDEAAEAVEAGLLFGPPARRGEMLKVLAQLSRRQAIPNAVAAFHHPVADESLRSVAESILVQSVGGTPNRAESEQFLAAQLEQRLAMLEQVERNTRATGIAWFVSESDEIDFRPVTQYVDLANDAFFGAERLRWIAVQDLTSVRMGIAADILYRYLSDPLYGAAADLEALDARWQASGGVDSRRLVGILTDPVPDAVRFVTARLLGTTADRTIVASAGPEPTPLVELAIAGPSAAIRYEAAAAIADLDPQLPFAGASQVAELWDEISMAPLKPQAMIVENLASSRSRGVNWLQELGYDTVAVSNGRAAIERFVTSPAIELILIGPDPVDFSTVELLDRLRRRPGGAAVPILLYNQPPSSAPHDRWNGPLVAVTDLSSSQELRAHVNRLLEMRRVEPLGIGDFAFVQLRVNEMLERIEKNPARYPAFIAAEQFGTITAAAAE